MFLWRIWVQGNCLLFTIFYFVFVTYHPSHTQLCVVTIWEGIHKLLCLCRCYNTFPLVSPWISPKRKIWRCIKEKWGWYKAFWCKLRQGKGMWYMPSAMCTEMVLTNCWHAMRIKCYCDWYELLSSFFCCFRLMTHLILAYDDGDQHLQSFSHLWILMHYRNPQIL